MSASPPDPRDVHNSSSFVDSSELADLSYAPRRSETGYQPLAPQANPFDDDNDIGHGRARGLGIDNHTSPIVPEERNTLTKHVTYDPTLGVSSPKSPYGQAGVSSANTTPGLNNDFLSPISSHGFQQDTYYRGATTSEDAAWRAHRNAKPSVSSLNSNRYDEDDLYDPYLERGDDQRLNQLPSTLSRRSAYETGFDPNRDCVSENTFYQSTAHWLSISIYVLSFYSTIWSGIFLVIGLLGPTYPWISNRSGASINPNGAIILVSVIAKTIELSFATAFVAFLGQALSRRAFNKKEGLGITIAEMNMRSWIMQPGVMITHWETVFHAGFTLLGVLSLVAAVMATLYTSAATALVQPQLKFNDWETHALGNPLQTLYGNATHVASQCRTPQLNDLGDSSNPAAPGTFSDSAGLKQSHSSCLQIEYAAQSYQNYIQYFRLWTAPDLSATADMKNRPRGVALWNLTTEVTGSWIDVQTIDESSQEINRTVHQVNLAMPHVGVMSAAINESNGILQPSDLNGQGLYSLRAAVVSPVVHVICANLERRDLAPIVYEEWDTGNNSAREDIIKNWNPSSWQTLSSGEFQAPGNSTIMDKLFGWSGDGRVPFDEVNGYPDAAHARPIFPKFPLEFNTILNHSGLHGREQIYMLGKPPVKLIDDDTFLFCSIKTSLTAKCSTKYAAEGSNRGSLKANCEGEDLEMQFDKKYPEAAEVEGGTNASKDWIWMGSEWGNGVNLNDGLNAGNGSNMRALTYLALPTRELNTSMPSPAEALAVMASSTLLMGIRDAPFDLRKNYTAEDLQGVVPEVFDNLIQSQLYTSGVHTNSAKGFHIVLLTVFGMNLFVCLYFVGERGFITDYTEPPNMFTIAMNSPPTRVLKGGCGRGPNKKQYDSNWFVEMDASDSERAGHLYMVPGEHEADETPGLIKRKRKVPSSLYQISEPTPHTPDHMKSPMLGLYDKFSNKRRSML